METVRVAVLIPCYNEEATIAAVVRDFAAALPEAVVYVYDNNSTDRTAEIAAAAGARVRTERRQGKGHVICRMFADVEADIYVLVDGDDTYDAQSAPRMIRQLRTEVLDVVNGARLPTGRSAYRPGHRLGNVLLSKLVAGLFGDRFADFLTGYRVFSRRFVKSFPALESKFEIEAALVVHALELWMPVAEVATPYRTRPEGSASKLHTVRDGFRVLWTIFRLLEENRPLLFFGLPAPVLALLSLGLGYPLIVTYLETGVVYRLPTAVLVASMMVLACLCLGVGLILEMVTLQRREAKRLRYLSLSPPPSCTGSAGS